MRQEIGRRTFVGSVIAGLPLLTQDAFALPQSGAVAHVHAADPVIDELARQLRSAVKALHDNPRAEHARAIGSILRLTAAHATAIGLDSTWKRGLEQRVREAGLPWVLARDIDPRQWQAEATAFGAPELQPPYVAASDREKGLNAILTVGISGTLQRAAVEFESHAAGLARRADQNGLVPVQYDCSSLNNMLSIIQWEIAIACGLSFIDGGVACAFITGTYVGLQAMAWIYGCW